jgi:predicted O-methyltransferase YrrM
METPIHLRNVPWPAERFDHPQFIASIAKWYKPNLFVEYGTGHGIATKVYAPFCKKVLAVDLNHADVSYISNLTFYKMTTREFKTNVLDKLTQTIDMAFIDADHKWEVAFQDFEDLFPKMTENGIIFIHDTYPCSEKWADPIFSSDSWIVPNKIKEKYSDRSDIFTIPVQPGLTMVRKYPKELSHMPYSKLFPV